MKNRTKVLLYVGFIVICTIYDVIRSRDIKPQISEELEISKAIPYTSESLISLDKVSLVRVIDADTLLVDKDNKLIRVRLIGINAPESVHPDESKNTAAGKNASEYMKELLKNEDYVYLEYDAELNDTYGRTLAYVYMQNGQMIEDVLIKNALAEVMTVEPNTKYEDHFKSLYVDSVKEKGN